MAGHFVHEAFQGGLVELVDYHEMVLVWEGVVKREDVGVWGQPIVYCKLIYCELHIGSVHAFHPEKKVRFRINHHHLITTMFPYPMKRRIRLFNKRLRNSNRLNLLLHNLTLHKIVRGLLHPHHILLLTHQHNRFLCFLIAILLRIIHRFDRHQLCVLRFPGSLWDRWNVGFLPDGRLLSFWLDDQ